MANTPLLGSLTCNYCGEPATKFTYDESINSGGKHAWFYTMASWNRKEELVKPPCGSAPTFICENKDCARNDRKTTMEKSGKTGIPPDYIYSTETMEFMPRFDKEGKFSGYQGAGGKTN